LKYFGIKVTYIVELKSVDVGAGIGKPQYCFKILRKGPLR
jgi:hypothetical protein